MELTILLLQIAAKYGPEAYAAAVALLAKKDPTHEDYVALHVILKKTGESYFAPVPG